MSNEANTSPVCMFYDVEVVQVMLEAIYAVHDDATL